MNHNYIHGSHVKFKKNAETIKIFTKSREKVYETLCYYVNTINFPGLKCDCFTERDRLNLKTI